MKVFLFTINYERFILPYEEPFISNIVHIMENFKEVDSHYQASGPYLYSFKKQQNVVLEIIDSERVFELSNKKQEELENA